MNLISYTIWGESPRYCWGAERQPEQAREYYPGWQVRFYSDHERPELIDAGAEVVVCGPNTGHSTILRRLRALSDPEAYRVIFRDCDAVLSAREAAAVEEWINADEIAHAMHDSPWHGDSPLMGGLWGLKGGIPEIEDLIAEWQADPYRLNVGHERWWESVGEDCFLAKKVWPRVKDSCLTHASIPVRWNARAFPELDAVTTEQLAVGVA